ncbi:hypothetical protein H4R33_000821 [Dimargaris cristalligena]|nr:hypothetical protein H4R33_000821 [Dimargaris cristalligena]
MTDANLKIGADYMAEAHSYTKSGWFRKPEWDIAGQLYEKAATAFKAGRSPDNAIRAYQKSGEALAKFGSVYLAGNAYEKAGIIAQQSQDKVLAIEMYIQASNLYLAHGSSPDKAAGIVEKAAQLCEPLDPDRAIELYKQSCSIFESEDRDRMAIETIKNAVGCAIRLGQLPTAVYFLDKLAAATRVLIRRSETDKARLSAIVVTLALDDMVEARKRLDAWLFVSPDPRAPSGSGGGGVSGSADQWGGATTMAPPADMSHEAFTAQALVDAFEHWDGPRLQEILKNPQHVQTLQFLLAEVVRLAFKLNVPGSGTAPAIAENQRQPPSPATSTGNPAKASGIIEKQPPPPTSQTQPPPSLNEDDDGLC